MIRKISILLLLVLFSLNHSIYAEEFQCPEGTKDSGYEPGHVVRWCEIVHEGRLLYHGPLWRWYRNGQMSGKEKYIYGDADGVWPSWYDNGKPSSLGAFKDGSKTGEWKYWDKKGWMTFKVTYRDGINNWNEYYPSGKKKAEGKSARSGMLGKWTYWDDKGTVIAKCDFGEGLFELKEKDCKTIVNTLSPNRYSKPVPKGTVGNNKFSIKLANQKYFFNSPKEWVVDSKSGEKEGIPIVMYKSGSKWKGEEPNIYLRAIFKGDKNFQQTIAQEKDGFERNVSGFTEIESTSGKLNDRVNYKAIKINYNPLMHTDSPFSVVSSNKIYEKVTYIDVSKQVVLMAVLACHNKKQLSETVSLYDEMLRTIKVLVK